MAGRDRGAGEQLTALDPPHPVAALRGSLEDPANRRWLVDLVGVADILSSCIIGSTFKATIDWTDPIVLTKLGEDVEAGVRERNKKVRPLELRLSLLLRLGTPAGLLIDRTTDIEQLRRVTSDSLLRQRILLPYMFGRDLHDAAADLFPEQSRLDNGKTVRLLKKLPVGVFQSGYLTTGPFGCLASRSHRSLSPRRSVPGYHCSDVRCHSIHNISLATCTNTPIHRAATALRDFITDTYPEDDDHPRLIREARMREAEYFLRPPRECVFDTIGDGFTLDETRALVDGLLRLRFQNPLARAELSRALDVAILNPTDFVKTLHRAQLMQLLLMHSDKEVTEAIDVTLNGDALFLNEWEVRVQRVKRSGGSLQAEIGSNGICIRSDRPTALFSRQLLMLLHHIYMKSAGQSRADLQYLAGVNDPELDDRGLLNRIVHSLDPTEIVDKLIVASRTAALTAAEFFWIPDAEAMGRDELRSALMWRLGLPGAVAFNELGEVEFHADRLRNAVGSGADAETTRGCISSLFTSLESALQRALGFSLWALMSDHVTAKNGFEYNPLDSGASWDLLDELAPVSPGVPGLERSGKNGLAALGAGFSRLAKALGGVDSTQWERSPDQTPDECVRSDRPFAFMSTLPYLNLSSKSQADIVTALSTIAARVQHATVLRVRNSTLHGNWDFPTSEEITMAVNDIVSCCSVMAESGLFPSIFDLASTTRDSFGRECLRFESTSKAIEIRRPSWAIASRMPSTSRRLVILADAEFPGVGPLRFRLRTNPGDDPYWTGWPRRWKSLADYGSDSDEMPEQVDIVEEAFAG